MINLNYLDIWKKKERKKDVLIVSFEHVALSSSGQHAALQAGDGPGDRGQRHHDEGPGPQGQGAEAAQQERRCEEVVQAEAQRASVRRLLPPSFPPSPPHRASGAASELGAMIRLHTITRSLSRSA